MSTQCQSMAGAAALAAVALVAATAARADFQAALREHNAGHYDTTHSRGLALAELGDCQNAVAHQERALRKAQSLGRDARLMAGRMAAYRAGRAGRAWQGDLFASS
jgi:hypothetical protein